MRKFSMVIGAGVFVFMLVAVYMTFYEGAWLRDAESGRILFGYDGLQGRLIVNEYPPDSSQGDGPHIFFRGDRAVVVRTDGDGSLLYDTLSIPQVYGRSFTVAGAGAPAFEVNLQVTPSIPRAVYDMPERLLAFSDIEGDFGAFKRLLIENGVTDSALIWTFGDGHLVLTGDFMDRGHDVTACLWLIYSLEEQARRDGGCVHFLLGNHELMAMRGQGRFSAGKYPRLAERLGVDLAALYGAETELGRWLRTHNSIERIGDALFVHGGVSKAVAELGLSPETMNTIVRQYIDHDEGVLPLPAAALLDEHTGLLWYRGWVVDFGNVPKLTEPEVRFILQKMGVQRMIVGHTPVAQISTRYSGQLVCLNAVRPGETAGLPALFMDKGKPFIACDNGRRYACKGVAQISE